MSINITQDQLTYLIHTFQTAVDVLSTLNQKQDTRPLWESASTTSVSNWTLEQYDWKPLRKWCVDRDIDIGKEMVNGLQVNSYPAQAWLEVYGIVLGKFNV